jgi:hypothetical protein
MTNCAENDSNDDNLFVNNQTLDSFSFSFNKVIYSQTSLNQLIIELYTTCFSFKIIMKH